eukprot:7388496-Prymnesium_polylepis.1
MVAASHDLPVPDDDEITRAVGVRSERAIQQIFRWTDDWGFSRQLAYEHYEAQAAVFASFECVHGTRSCPRAHMHTLAHTRAFAHAHTRTLARARMHTLAHANTRALVHATGAAVARALQRMWVKPRGARWRPRARPCGRFNPVDGAVEWLGLLNSYE